MNRTFDAEYKKPGTKYSHAVRLENDERTRRFRSVFFFFVLYKGTVFIIYLIFFSPSKYPLVRTPDVGLKVFGSVGRAARPKQTTCSIIDIIHLDVEPRDLKDACKKTA